MSEPPPPKPPKPGRPRRLSCPGCGGSIEIRANGISISAICPSCGRTVDVASDDLKIIAEAQRNTRTPEIPIGTRGTLAGTEWEVVGYQSRSNPAEGWTWDEYLLFNPYRGFRFLAHDDEGWTLYAMLRQDIPDPANVTNDRHHYAGPETSQARTDYVLGEFYWRVRVGDAATVEQYAAGSTLLVKEATGDEIVWSRGVPVDAAAIRTAFKLAPPPATQTSQTERERTISALKIAAAALVLLILLYAIPLGSNASQLVFQRSYTVTAADRGKPIASDLFTVPGNSGNLRFDLQSPVSDNWVALSLSLVGEAGTPVFDAEDTIEYYSGYEDGESWSEGSQEARIMFRNIPGGRYRLLVDADAGVLSATPPTPAVTFSIEARRHVPASEWFWLGLLLILTYPLYRLFFKRSAAK